MKNEKKGKSIKCKCGYRIFYRPIDVVTDENNERYLFCDECGKKIKLKK